MKICKTCRLQKPLEQFRKSAKAKSGYHYQCKKCFNKFRPSRAKPPGNTQKLSLTERFFCKINPTPTPNGCWIWEGSCADYRYGQIRHNNTFLKAHRLSYEIYIGPIGSYNVCHTCDNPRCVNPNHLFLGTHQENMRDKNIKQRQFKPKSEDCVFGRLNPKKVIEIRLLNKQGWSCKDLSSKFNVTERTIKDVVSFRTWKNLRS